MKKTVQKDVRNSFQKIKKGKIHEVWNRIGDLNMKWEEDGAENPKAYLEKVKVIINEFYEYDRYLDQMLASVNPPESQPEQNIEENWGL